MKKVYYTNVRYTAIVKIAFEDGTYKWLREDNISINEAKKLYLSVKQNKGAKVHVLEQCWFYGHLPNCLNGTLEAILLEEVKPFYFSLE